MGTFSASPYLTSIAQCLQCSPGSYCARAGASAVSGPCSAGYFCVLSSSYDKPLQQAYGSECPEGSYCPVSSASPTACPIGTFNPSRRSVNISSCISCSAGWACNSTGLSTPSFPCAAGYYCSSGAYTTEPTGNSHNGGICPPGMYCPTQSSYPLPCNAGYYADSSGFSACRPCPAGYYCNNESTISPRENVCPSGYYCPISSTLPTACPVGYYNPSLGTTSFQDGCIACLPGYHCPLIGMGNSTVYPCPIGYFCPGGDGVTPVNICPVGFFCG